MFLLVQAKKFRTVRFRQLLGESGEPEQVILWSEPEQDKGFMKAVTENRVATVVQRNVGAKKDYGLVGFVSQPKAAFIAFPKQLDYPTGTKIVGIDYDSIKQPQPEGPLHVPRPAWSGQPLRRGKPQKSEVHPQRAGRSLMRERSESPPQVLCRLRWRQKVRPRPCA